MPLTVTYTDSAGYTASIVDEVHSPPEQDFLKDFRKGTHFITNPKGETVQAGYWMDWAEPEWIDAEGLPLHGSPDAEARYYALPKLERNRECKQQALSLRIA